MAEKPALNQDQSTPKFADDAKASLLAAASAAAATPAVDPGAFTVSAKPHSTPSESEPKTATTPTTPAVAPTTPAETPKTPTTPPAASTTPADKPKESKGIAEVRSALERSQARLKELEDSGTATTKQLAEATTRVADLTTKLAAKEDEIEKTYKPIAQKLTEREKRLQEIEEQLRIRDYTATPEYHDKYERPLATARTDVEQLLSEIEVTDANGQPRKATPQDFNFVLEAATLNESARRAKALFGEDIYQTVVNQATRMKQLVRQREEGRKQAALESAEYIKRQQATQAQLRESLRNQMLSKSEAMLKDYVPPETDQELQQAYREALDFADKSIAGDPTWTHDQLATTLGKARAEITAAGVLRKQLARRDAKIAELESKLTAYESSTPDVTPRNGGKIEVPENSREAILKRMEADALKFATR